MKELHVQPESQKSADQPVNRKADDKKPLWETPRLEDVSEQVMAQPYIRFT